ncbi:MAG TPA: nuclear transport factor 2 family protein, partial [Acidimicrobiia bacterium]|nr:nuclear transport factor 2 family protein [Acidimicrobiia bacterium]
MTMTDTALSTLADKIAIRELTAVYNRAVDDGRVEDALATFVPGGSLEIPGMGALSEDSLRGLFSSLQGNVHATTDAIVEIDGDRAR